jgi:hypothetical protein
MKSLEGELEERLMRAKNKKNLAEARFLDLSKLFLLIHRKKELVITFGLAHFAE